MSKVFVLSLPKSGTYLWSNILKQLGYTFCGKHIAYSGYQTVPDDRQQLFLEPGKFYQKSPLSESLKFIDDGQFAVGHLPCTPETIHLLEDFELIFSYRDLKDSIISFVNYAAKFQTNKDKQWTNDSQPAAIRVEQFLRTDAIDFIELVNSVAGWKSQANNNRILQAEYTQVVRLVPELIQRTSEFFDISAAQMTDKVQQALDLPSFTKIENKLKTENNWSEAATDYYNFYSLDKLNYQLGFDQPATIASPRKSKKAAIICNPQFVYYKFVQDYLRAFEEFKEDYEVEFIPVQMMGETSVLYDLSNYSLVVISFHIRPWLARWGNVEFESALFRYQGTKVLLLHDEYDETNALKKWIQDFSINHVFSVIPPQYLASIYPVDQFPGVNFHSVLTAYVTSDIPDENAIPPICLRTMDIVYRGRAPNPWLGELVKEKYQIGEYFKSLDKHDLLMDLDSQENERIYGEAWLQFLMSSKATLGTESGSNVFDVDGSIRQWFEMVSEDEDGSIAQIPEELNFKEMNLGVKMNQISPKIFEAISCKTALILYTGDYSDVLKAGVHYIELKKDHSNIDEVVAKLADTEYLQHTVDTAYKDIIESGNYSYKSIMNKIYSTNCSSTEQNIGSSGILQKGSNFNNLLNNQLAEKTALLKASSKRVQSLTTRHVNFKNNADKKANNMQLAIENLKARIEKLKMNNNRYQEKIKALEKFKQETQSTLSWKMNKKAQDLIARVKR